MFFLVALFIGAGAWYLYERSQRHSYPVSPGLRPEIALPHTDEWELYQNSISLCSKKLRVCMLELDLPYRDHHVHLIETGGYGNLSREFLKVNPSFTVPVLVHKGHPIYESDEQIVYAAQHAGELGAELLGTTDAEKAEVARWIELGALKGDPTKGDKERAGSCVPGMTIPIFTTMIRYIPYWKLIEGFLFHPDRRRPALFTALKFRGIDALPDMLVRVIQDSRRGMMVHMAALEKKLAHGQPWLCGERFTLADVRPGDGCAERAVDELQRQEL